MENRPSGSPRKPRHRTLLGLVLVLAGSGRGVAGELYGEGLPADVRGLLQASEASKRQKGIEALEELDLQRAAPLLLQKLADSDAGVRALAAGALGRRQVLEAAAPLIDRLADSDAGVRQASAEALGQLGALPPGLAGKAAQGLGRALGDAQHEVRQEVLRTLGRLLSLRMLGPAEAELILGPVVLRLDDENVGVRRAAVAALGRLPTGPAAGSLVVRAVVPLLSKLSDAARDVRAEALASLGALGAQRATPAVLRLLQDPAEEVRRQAALCLGRLETAAAVPALIELFTGSGSEVLRGAAAQALGQIAKGEGQLKIAKGEGQLKIAKGEGPDPLRAGQAPLEAGRAAQALVQGLARPELRGISREALLALGVRAVPALTGVLGAGQGGAAWAGPAEVSAVIGVLRDVGQGLPAASRGPVSAALVAELDRGRVLRESLLEALGAVGDRSAGAVCAGYLQDSDAAVRRRAAAALRRIGDERAQGALLAAAGDKDAEVRRQAILALGELRARQAAPQLAALLQQGDAETRAAAATALGQILGAGSVAGEAELRGLRGLLQVVTTYREGDAERRARRAAVEALGMVKGAPLQEVVPPLVAVLRRAGAYPEGDSALPEAVAALGGVLRGRRQDPLLPKAREALLALAETSAPVHTPGAALALDALEALGALRDQQSGGHLLRLLGHRDPLRRVRAVFALGCLLAESPGDHLVKGLVSVLGSDEDGRVRAEAAWALSRLQPGAGGRERALAGLRQALRRSKEIGGDSGERANAAAALAILGDGVVGDAELLLDRDPGVRANGALLVGLLAAGSPGLQARLRALAEADDDRQVRAAARAALEGAGSRLGPAQAGARRHWLGLHWLDPDRQALAEARYRLTLPEGLVRVGTTDGRGTAREELLLPGKCTVDLIEEGQRSR